LFEKAAPSGTEKQQRQFMGRGATCGYHCTAKALSFGKGQSAVHTAAYNAREKLYQEQQERWSRDYSREGEVLFKGIFAPAGAPEWTQDRQALWNRAEAAERQKVNGQPARNMIVGLPHELNQQQREWLVKDFAREAFARKGMIADVAMHAPDAKGDERNYHAHILLTMRKLDGDAFAKTKCRDWNRKEQLGEWREQWAEMGAKALHRAGYPVEAERWRHGHQTYAEQRAAALERGDKEFAESLGNREPTFHKGVKSTALERSGGSNERLARLEGVIARNDIKLEMKQLDGELARLEGLEAATKILADREAARQSGLTKAPPDMPAPKARGVKSDGVAAGVDERAERRETKFWQDQKAWRASMREQTPKTMKPAEQGLEVANSATGAVTSLADFVSDLLTGSSAKPEPEKKADMGAYVSDPAARKERQLARAAAAREESNSEKAIESIRKDMETGRRLKPEDVQHLTREHQEQIRSKGDDYVRQMVDDAREKLERSSRGEGRERD